MLSTSARLLRVAADSPEGLLVLVIGRDVQLVKGEAMVPEVQQVLANMSRVFAPMVAQ